MDAKLIVVGGDVKTTEVNLKLPTIVGRGKGAGLLLQHPLVSRQHCEIYEHEGQLAVRDLGSLNGTYINNTRLTEPTVLPSGELLTIGTVTFRAEYTVDPNLRPPVTPAKAKDATLRAASNETVQAEPEADVDFMESIAGALEEVEEIEVVEETPESVEAIEAIEEVEEIAEVEIEEVIVEEQAGDAADDFVDDMLAALEVEEVEEVKPDPPQTPAAPAKASQAQKPNPPAPAPASKPASAPPGGRWALPAADEHETLRARPEKPGSKPASAPTPKPKDEEGPTMMQSSTSQSAMTKGHKAERPGNDDIQGFLAGLAASDASSKPADGIEKPAATKTTSDALEFLAAIGTQASADKEDSPVAGAASAEVPSASVAVIDAPQPEHAGAPAAGSPAANGEIGLAGADSASGPDSDSNSSAADLVRPSMPPVEDIPIFPMPEVMEEVVEDFESAPAEPVADFAENAGVLAPFVPSEPVAPPEPPEREELISAFPPVAEAAEAVEIEEVEATVFEADEQAGATVEDSSEEASGALSDADFVAFLDTDAAEDGNPVTIEASAPDATEAAAVENPLTETFEESASQDEFESPVTRHAASESGASTESIESVAGDAVVPPATEEPVQDSVSSFLSEPAPTVESGPVKPKKRPHAAPRFPFQPQARKEKNMAASSKPASAPPVESAEVEPLAAPAPDVSESPQLPVESQSNLDESSADAAAGVPEALQEDKLGLDASAKSSEESPAREDAKTEAEAMDDDLAAFLKNLGK